MQEHFSRGTKIRERRESLQVSQVALARAARVNRGTLAAIETGMRRGRPYERGPHSAMLESIEAALERLERAPGQLVGKRPAVRGRGA